LLAALIEAALAAHHCQHAAHARGTGNAFHVQFPISRAVATVAVPTQVIAAFHPHRTQRGQNLFGTLALRLCRVTAAAGSVFRLWSRQGQQPLQGGGSGTVHRVAHQHLDRF
jgi:hypothetical protein